MIPYIIVFIISLSFTALANRYSNSKVYFFIFSVLAIFPPVILAGFRDLSIGTDIKVYAEYYFNLAGNYNSFLAYFKNIETEFIFSLICYYTNKFFGIIYAEFFFTELIIVLNYYLALSMLRKYLSPTFGMLIFLFLFFNLSLNLMRQSISMSFCFLGLAYYMKNELIKVEMNEENQGREEEETYYYSKYKSIYLVLIFLMALLSHKTSFFFILPFFMINYFSYKKNRSFFKITAIFFGFILIFLFSDKIISILISGSSLFSDRYLAYKTNEQNGRSVISTIFILKNLFLICFLMYFKNYYSQKSIAFNNLAIINTLGVLFLGLLTIVSIPLGRLNFYFEVVNVFLYPLALKNIEERNKKRAYLIFSVMIIFYWWYVYIVKGNGETAPYHSIVLGL